MRQLKFVCLLLFSTSSLLFTNLSHAQFIFEKLSDSREDIVFPDLTEAEKLTVAEQARLLLQGVYVHRFQKQDFYPGVIDPAEAIQEVVDNIDDLSVPEMQEQISRIFASQRDLHLGYFFPEPYSNYQTFLPLTFKRIEEQSNFFEVRVDATNPAQFVEFAPDQRVPEVGDQVIAYNGAPIGRAVEENLTDGRGANRFGGFSRALSTLTFKPQFVNLVPEQDEVSITFRGNRADGGAGSEDYTITLSWITAVPDPASDAQISTSQDNVQDQPKRKLTRDDLLRAEDKYQEVFNNFRVNNDLMPQSTFPSSPSNEPALTWGIIENARGKFGYLNLASFIPVNGTDFTIAEIRRIIFEEFEDTEGLIFDVRNNGGGIIDLADRTPQLFTRGDAVANQGRLLNTDENLEIFNNSDFGLIFPTGRDALNAAAGTDATLTAPFTPFGTPESVNIIGQLYNGPVAVFANANSYSAADLFPCQMQDAGAALLVGEEPLTGAGGANVIQHADFAQFVPTVFSPLPSTHGMSVSHIQAIRSGRSDGKLIEDFGCRADMVVSPRSSDILDGGASQVERITATLQNLSLSPRFQSSVRAPSNDSVLIRQADDLDFPIEVENTPMVRLTINGEIVSEVFVENPSESTTVPLSFPDSLVIGEVNSVLIEGIDNAGERLWNLKRVLTVTEEPVVVGEDGLSIDFATATSVAPFTIVNQNPAEDGWNLVAPALEIGYNPEYANGVNSDALLALDLSALESAQLSFDLEYGTELDFDFVDVFVTDSDGNVLALLRESGTAALQTYDFDISEFAGKAGVQVHFRLVTDTNTVAQGVRLQRVSIQ